MYILFCSIFVFRVPTDLLNRKEGNESGIDTITSHFPFQKKVREKSTKPKKCAFKVTALQSKH